MKGITIPHYHVITGFRGCLPETNDIYPDYASALNFAREIVRERRMVLRSDRRLLKRKRLRPGEDVFWEDRGPHSTFYVQVVLCDSQECMDEFVNW